MLFILCPNSYSSCLLVRPAHLTPEKPCSNVSGPVSPQAVAHIFRAEFPYFASSLNYLYLKQHNLCFPFPYLSPSQSRVLLHLSKTDIRIKRNKNGQQKTGSGHELSALCPSPGCPSGLCQFLLDLSQPLTAHFSQISHYLLHRYFWKCPRY